MLNPAPKAILQKLLINVLSFPTLKNNLQRGSKQKNKVLKNVLQI
jgi:hypothetical protein